MMAVYTREKVNPAASCLPIVIQIPVFFALYKVLFISIEMRHAPFYGWVHDLSARDPTSIINLFGLLPFGVPAMIPDFISIGLWPLVMGVSMFLPMRLHPTPPYPIQATGIFVDENNAVGIGTATPIADLYIDGTGSTDAALILHEPGASTGELIFGSPAGSPGIVAMANNGNRRDIRFSDVGIEFLTSSTAGSPAAGQGLTITEDGNAGIATTTP